MGEFAAPTGNPSGSETYPSSPGLGKLLNRLGAITADQQIILNKFRAGEVEETAEVDDALEAERDERIKENLPPVVDFYISKYQRQLEEARQKKTDPFYRGTEEHFAQHDIKVSKDLLRMLQFEPWQDNMSDQEAQDTALWILLSIMIDSCQPIKGFFKDALPLQKSKDITREERRIKESEDPEDPTIIGQLTKLDELADSFLTLIDDLTKKNPYQKWPPNSVIETDWTKSDLQPSDILVANIDPDYYRAYYGKYGTFHEWSSDTRAFREGKISDRDLTQRIRGKWE